MSVDKFLRVANLTTRYGLSGLILLFFSLPLAASITVENQRQLFKQAEKALDDGNLQVFSDLKAQLDDYPVVAYLRYDAFKRQLSSASNQDVSEFLQQHSNYPFKYHLLSKWLSLLAKREQWEDYLAFYDGRKETRFKCLELNARLQTGQTKGINAEISKLWLTGYSQPDECDNAFEHYLETADNITQAIWQRIEKAFKARRPSLAKYLAKKLDQKDQAIVAEWYQAHRDPARHIKRFKSRKDTLVNRKIIIHTLDRLARKDSLLAKQYWHDIKPDFDFNTAQIDQIDKRIALSAAYQHKAESKQLLEHLPTKLKSDNAHLWLARIHLRDEDWIGLIRTINAMPDRLSKEAEWVYWLARAYDEAGHSVKANEIYHQLSDRSTYYGFLAADKVNKNYRIQQQQVTINVPVDESKLLQKNINLLRARELFYLDRRLQARREWFQAIRKLSQAEIKQAASLASTWKWHDNAIKTVAKTSHRNDYDLRFPMPYQQLVMNNVRKHDLDPSVIYGVMRRESLFDPLAKSRVGALGLMQLSTLR